MGTVPRNAWDIARESIRRAGELKISDRYRMVTGQPISNVDNTPLFPAIAIPVETKSGFECPGDHLDCLRANLQGVTKILIVGWRATEKHFLNLLSGAVPDKTPMQVVAGDKDSAEATFSQISAAGIMFSVTHSTEGSASTWSGRETENFLKA
jgi:hypothetical protein